MTIPITIHTNIGPDLGFNATEAQASFWATSTNLNVRVDGKPFRMNSIYLDLTTNNGIQSVDIYGVFIA